MQCLHEDEQHAMWRYRSAGKGQGVQFQMGEEVVAPGKDKQEQKDSKTCSIM